MELKNVLNNYDLPDEISVVLYDEVYFTSIQSLYEKEGWMTAVNREADAKAAWKTSQIALVLLHNEEVVGLVRALTDGLITTYIAELLIKKEFRGRGLGNLLIDICHLLYPKTRLDLISAEEYENFYRANKFKESTGFRKSYRI